MTNWKKYALAAVIAPAGFVWITGSHRNIPADLRDAAIDTGWVTRSENGRFDAIVFDQRKNTGSIPVPKTPAGKERRVEGTGASGNRNCSCKPFLNITDPPPAEDFTGIESAPSLKELRASFSEKTDPFYKKYSDTGIINEGRCIDTCYDKIPYRHSDGDRCSYEHIKDRIGELGKSAAVFMDSGGAHSIAMAALLVNEAGYTPVIKLNKILESPGIKEDVASIKFFARALFAKDNAGGPPVFIMNAHRPKINGSFSEKDFPSPREFLNKGINKVVWITEGETDAKPEPMDKARLETLTGCSSDPANMLKAYSEYAGGEIEVSQMRINPYDCPYSRRARRMGRDLPSMPRSR